MIENEMMSPLVDEFPPAESIVLSYEVESTPERPEKDELGIVKNFDIKTTMKGPDGAILNMCIPYSRL